MLWHEVQVGLILGLLVGIAGFMRAWTYNQSAQLGITLLQPLA